MRVAIRGFAQGRTVFEEFHTLQRNNGTSEGLLDMAMRHAGMLWAHPRHAIEIEFLDEPNPRERFIRFGTDPDAMVMPIPINQPRAD